MTAPWPTRAHNPEDGLDEAPVILGVQPGSLFLPGKCRLIRTHWSSRNIFRSNLTLHKSQDMTIFHPCEQPLAMSLTVNDLFDLNCIWHMAIRLIESRP